MVMVVSVVAVGVVGERLVSGGWQMVGGGLVARRKGEATPKRNPWLHLSRSPCLSLATVMVAAVVVSVMAGVAVPKAVTASA